MKAPIKIVDAITNLNTKNIPGRFIFRLENGKSPIIFYRYIADTKTYQQKKKESWRPYNMQDQFIDIFFECFYLVSGRSLVLTKNEMIVPMKLSLEDDNSYCPDHGISCKFEGKEIGRSRDFE